MITKTINKIFTITLFSVAVYALSFLMSPVVYANAVSCQSIYGGGQSCITAGNISIDKKVLNPASSAFVDNLGVNDPKYAPGFIVNFRLEVTNSGDTNIAKADVKDIFPQYIEFAAGPGNFDPKTKTLTFVVENLAPKETRTLGIVGKVVSIDQLPANQDVVCIINQAVATTGDKANSQDNSQFCIEKKATISPPPTTKGGFPVLSPVPTTSSPKTGPESLALLALIPTGITGLMLRKYAIKK